MATLKPQDQAPDFALLDQHGKQVKLSAYRGQTVLVYFYPKADTPGCTRQACSIRDHRQDLRALGIAVLGISPDLPEKQQKFDEKYGLAFPLLSDSDHTVAEAYGVWQTKTMYGKQMKGIVRSSFLIDTHGKITHTWYKVKPEETVAKAAEALMAGNRE